MDFSSTDRLDQLRGEGRRTGAREAGPSAAGRDENAQWDANLFTALAAAGLTGAMLSTRYGGLGLTAMETSALFEGFCEGSGDTGLALALAAHGLLGAVPIRRLGTARQRQRYLRPMARGEWICGLSLLELEGGATATGPVVRADRRGDGWVLNGTKTHVLNGPVAHHFVVTAITGPRTRSAFLIDRSTRGVTMRTCATAGPRTCTFGDLVLDECEVPQEALLGTVDGALAEFVPLVVAIERSLLLSPWVGVMRLLTDHVVQWIQEHEWFSRPMASFQSVRATVVEMRTRCELSAGVVHHASWQLDQSARPPRQDAAVAKLYVSAAAQATAHDAARVLGMSGLKRHGLVERVYRDSQFLTTSGGQPDLVRSVIAASLLDLG